MLEPFIPEPRLIEVDHLDLAVPPETAYQAARHMDLASSSLVRGLFAVRTVPDRLMGRASGPVRLSLDDLANEASDFRFLADQPGRGFVVGAIGRFWELRIPFKQVAPEQFAQFDEPGWGKVAWCVRVEPLGGTGSRMVFELRLTATDEESWRELRRYHRLIAPLSHFIRRHMLAILGRQLGTPESAEEELALAGDELLGGSPAQVTHAITINAPPEQIWPWLVQMGCHRAGWYSYDFLDNAGVPSARELHPELQAIKPGDVLPGTPKGTDGFEVLRVDAPRALVLGGLYDLEHQRQLPFASSERPLKYWQVTWAFVLEPRDARTTRLHARGRVNFPEDARLHALWIRPVHHFMQAEQLRNLKARAEGRLRRSHDTARDVGEGILGALGILFDLATPFLRPLRSHWGLDEATASRPYPGDDRIPRPKWSWTHGIEIDAPPQQVWPWVAQMGQDKGGLYSYQFLENLAGCDIQNADRIHPEWLAISPGDVLRLHPRMPVIPIVAVEPGRWISAHADSWSTKGETPEASGPERIAASWLFFLEPLPGGRTRFISRFRLAYSGEGLRQRVLYGPYLIESIGFVMDRRMLRGLKQRVEAARRRPSEALPSRPDAGASAHA
ncbi:MAG: hypothetical protein JXB05_19870 [Myxococcaceae bacterium]|nr:hypothetical protein [Myxococcaceae bacterium]